MPSSSAKWRQSASSWAAEPMTKPPPWIQSRAGRAPVVPGRPVDPHGDGPHLRHRDLLRGCQRHQTGHQSDGTERPRPDGCPRQPAGGAAELGMEGLGRGHGQVPAGPVRRSGCRPPRSGEAAQEEVGDIRGRREHPVTPAEM